MYSQAVDLHTTNAHSSKYYLRNCKQLTLLISAHAFPSNSLAGSSVVAPELQIHGNLSGYTTFSEERRLSASLSGVPFSSINTVNKALPVSVTVSFSSQHGDGCL